MTWLRLLLVLVATLSLTACEVIGDIFQAGMAVGVIMVIGVIALIGFLIAKVRSEKGRPKRRPLPTDSNPRQSGVGWSAASMMTTGIGPICFSSFNPSCC